MTQITSNQTQTSKPEGDATRTSKEQQILENTKTHFEGWNKTDADLMKTVTIEKITRYANGKLASSDQEGLAATMNFFKTALPDFTLTPGDIIINGNKSYTKWIVKGTNTGMFGDNQPTGKTMETHGIPIALKDNIDTAGIKTTAASGVYRDRIPTEDAEVTTLLRNAGAISLGKLNMHEFAFGTTSLVSYFGSVHNPWSGMFLPENQLPTDTDPRGLFKKK